MTGYTLDEIDRMREAVRELTLRWMVPERWVGGREASMTEASRQRLDRVSEDRLRTYMTNGTIPEELEARVAELTAKEKAEDAAWSARRLREKP